MQSGCPQPHTKNHPARVALDAPRLTSGKPDSIPRVLLPSPSPERSQDSPSDPPANSVLLQWSLHRAGGWLAADNRSYSPSYNLPSPREGRASGEGRGCDMVLECGRLKSFPENRPAFALPRTLAGLALRPSRELSPAPVVAPPRGRVASSRQPLLQSILQPTLPPGGSSFRRGEGLRYGSGVRSSKVVP
jgi:hypothetical protein